MQFFKLYLAEEAKDTKSEKEYISWEDRLAALYYEYAMKCGNKFVADWFELNLNINNVLTAITCRKYGFDKANYIVGHNEIAEISVRRTPVISAWAIPWNICPSYNASPKRPI